MTIKTLITLTMTLCLFQARANTEAEALRITAQDIIKAAAECAKKDDGNPEINPFESKKKSELELILSEAQDVINSEVDSVQIDDGNFETNPFALD